PWRSSLGPSRLEFLAAGGRGCLHVAVGEGSTVGLPQFGEAVDRSGTLDLGDEVCRSVGLDSLRGRGFGLLDGLRATARYGLAVQLIGHGGNVLPVLRHVEDKLREGHVKRLPRVPSERGDDILADFVWGAVEPEPRDVMARPGLDGDGCPPPIVVCHSFLSFLQVQHSGLEARVSIHSSRSSVWLSTSAAMRFARSSAASAWPRS